MDNQKYQVEFRRLGAAIVDGLVFSPLLLLEEWLFEKTDNITVIFVWTVFSVFISLFYSIYFHFKYGQTVGKWVAGVKVIDISEMRTLTLKQSIFRDFFYLTIQIFALSYFAFLAFTTDKSKYLYSDYRAFADLPILG